MFINNFVIVINLFAKFLVSIYISMAEVARYHGGDGGADPPPDPTRIPSQCESGIFMRIFLVIVYCYICFDSYHFILYFFCSTDRAF